MFDEDVKPEKLIKFIGSVRAVFSSKEAAEKWTEEHEYPCCFFVNVAEDEVTYTSFLVSGLDMCFVMDAVEKLLSELPCKGEFKECEVFGSFTLMGDNGFIVKFEPSSDVLVPYKMVSVNSLLQLPVNTLQEIVEIYRNF